MESQEKPIFPFDWNSNSDAISAASQDHEMFALIQGAGKLAIPAVSETQDQLRRVYKILRTKKFYLRAPKRCLRQTIKQGGRTILRLKKREPTTDAEIGGMVTTLKHWWAAVTGSMNMYLYRKDGILPILPRKYIRLPTLGEQPEVIWEEAEGEFLAGDILILLTKSLVLTLNQPRIALLLSTYLGEKKSVTEMAKLLIDDAKERRSGDYGILLLHKPIDTLPYHQKRPSVLARKGWGFSYV